MGGFLGATKIDDHVCIFILYIRYYYLVVRCQGKLILYMKIFLKEVNYKLIFIFQKKILVN